jgi:hypothetical protein
VLVAAVGGARAVGTSALGSTYTDPAGDAGAAADVTAVSVANDPTAGLITVGVTASGFSTSTAATEAVIVNLDTDLNPSTGSDGADYSLWDLRDAEGYGWDVMHWDGSNWQSVAQTPTMSFNRSGDVLTWTVGKADIAATSGFSLTVGSIALDASNTLLGVDVAPDGGAWTYTMTTPPPPPPPPVAFKPVIGTPTASPAVAGKRMVVRFPVTRSDTGGKLTAGKLVCDPSVSGKVIAHAEQFKGGVAQLIFTVPKAAKGKLLKVHVTIRTVSGQSATRTATFRVK